MIEIYCDGGQILASPSPYGGTWAFLIVMGGEVIGEEAGLLLPHHLDVKRITNNDSDKEGIA